MDDPLAEPVEAPTENAEKPAEDPGVSEGEPVQAEKAESVKVEEEHREGEYGEAEDGEGKHGDGEHGEVEHGEGEHGEGKHGDEEHGEGEHGEGEHGEIEHGEEKQGDEEYGEGEHGEGEQREGEHGEGDEGEHLEGEHGEEGGAEKQADNETDHGDKATDEEHTGEEMEGEHVEVEEQKAAVVQEEEVEEEQYVEPPPPDPAEPYNFTDSQEALKPPYELRPDQLAEVEQLWALYQDYTPAYTDLDNYITEKELVFMMKALLIMTYTPEQLQELIVFCVRPPSPEGHILYEQFLKMVMMRQRDFPVEEELRSALCVMDPGKTGLIDRAFFRETLSKLGHKMPNRLLEFLIKEVDIANDGTIGIEDVVGTLAIDLNREDIIMLMNIINPPEVIPDMDEIYDASTAIKLKHRSQQNLAENK